MMGDGYQLAGGELLGLKLKCWVVGLEGLR